MSSQPLSVIFDLDGTLIDSRPGIYASLKLAFEDAGQYLPLDPDQVPIGPPLVELVRLITGICEQDRIDFIVDRFIFHYDSSGYRCSTLFDCVHRLLDVLYCSSASLFIATNKRRNPTLKILDHLLISSFFKDVFAQDSPPDGYHSKSDMLKSLIQQYSLGSHTIYIGDRYEDFSAAVDNSLAFRFPFWGYDHERDLFPSNVPGINVPRYMDIDFLSWLLPNYRNT